jgi:hypothetical protein
MSAMDSPECFDGEIFGSRGITNDAENPPVDRRLMLAEEGFECVEIAVPELIQYGAQRFRHLACLSKPHTSVLAERLHERGGDQGLVA